METVDLLRALQEIAKRAERVTDNTQVVDTYVDSGGLASALMARDNGIIDGRRGTGKTHALLYLAERQRAQGDFALYVDIEQDLGSTEGIYGDTDLPLAERASRLLVDVLGKIHDAMLEEAFSGRGDLDALEGVLAHFGEVLVETEVEIEKLAERAEKRDSSAQLTASLAPSSVGLGAKLGSSENEQQVEGAKETRKGKPRVRVHFGATADLMRKAVESHPAKRFWLLFDEWSSLPLELQPYLAEMLRRLFFGLPKVTVRVAAIPHRAEWRVLQGAGYVGIEPGAEIFPLLDLDEFVVFPARSRAEQTDRSTTFFKLLLFRHVNNILAADGATQLDSPEQLISLLFTQVTALQELVRAAEGVPRDALNIVSRAALRAGEGKISTDHVRAAAAQVYQTTKSALLNGVPEAQDLLQIIIDEVISKKKARAFLLLQKDTRHPLIQRLIDDRILHVIKKGYSSKDDPGTRFDVLQIDFGCYVSLLQTKSAPQGLFGEEVGDDNALDALYGAAPTVPEDDYRAIRSAVLDLPRVLETVQNQQSDSSS